MAEQTAQETAPQSAATPSTEEVVVVADVAVQDSPPHSHPSPDQKDNEKEKEAHGDGSEKQKAPPLPENEEVDHPPLKADPTETQLSSNDDKIPESDSFNEESTRLSDLPDLQRKALDDLRHLVREALNNHRFSSSSPPKPEPAPPLAAVEEEKPKEAAEESNQKEDEKPEAQDKEEANNTIDETAPAEKKSAETSQVAVDHSTDDDGAKTVEAIEETIVAVSASEPKEAEKVPDQEDNKAKDESSAAQSQPEPERHEPEEVSIWGIPLLADDRSDVILLKFLRARDFKVKDAFAMLDNTIRWRKEFGIEQLVEQESSGSDLEKVVFMHGQDKEGHPVCYNVYGEFQNKELYQKTFSDDEKRQNFLRWRIQFLERSIRKLDFSPGGVSTIVQVNDLNNSPGPAKWELRQATKQALHLLQDNYPEFVAKQVFINVPWWYLAVNRMISPFLTQRTKSKFVVASPSKSAATLLRYIAAEQIPVKYGGLSKDGEFDPTDAVTEITLRPAAKHTVEFPATESCVVSWEVRVVGWEVKYGAEFVPSAEDSYTVIIQKTRKLSRSCQEPVLSNSFKIGEPGKVVLTIDNPTSKKKKLLYRLKTKPSSHKCA